MAQHGTAGSSLGTYGDENLTCSTLAARYLSSLSTDKEAGNASRLSCLGSDRKRGIDDELSFDFDGDLRFLSSLYTTPRTPSADNPICLSPPSDPLSSPPGSICAANQGSSKGDDTEGFCSGRLAYANKVSKRQAQNREAQRRFRERREQERAHLLGLLQKLGAENKQITNNLNQMQEKYITLEARAKQLQTEGEILRRWRQEIMCSMAGLVQHPNLADEVLEAVASSCSYDCWRRGIQRTRAFIVMQTLASLFAGVEDGNLSLTVDGGNGGEGASGELNNIEVNASHTEN
ncbi:hypothetical protein ASPCAL14643 [Aspergillus calidoustus]|uniref:BZIP domain-containing protein n=1 Tax=Aspergillus calidoustus TaxID=454130 RepID=A0A0U5GI95_ASPCI|nr:hypothetical protein ASPCAL14643 [Aspergillus calidoustus]